MLSKSWAHSLIKALLRMLTKDGRGQWGRRSAWFDGSTMKFVSEMFKVNTTLPQTTRQNKDYALRLLHGLEQRRDGQLLIKDPTEFQPHGTSFFFF